ncbi:MAG: RecQ family zinc-binding domain-containing protein, partial [Gemmatimonadaceae bacterium]
GTLRMLATPDRLAVDRSIDPADAEFAQALLARHGAPLYRGLGLDRRQLAQGALHDTPDRILGRLAQHQVALWRPPQASWHVARAPRSGELEALASRQHERVGRDRWRLRQVATFLATPRCRRAILLRYFGDAPQSGSCGACDRCLAAP